MLLFYCLDGESTFDDAPLGIKNTKLILLDIYLLIHSNCCQPCVCALLPNHI